LLSFEWRSCWTAIQFVVKPRFHIHGMHKARCKSDIVVSMCFGHLEILNIQRKYEKMKHRRGFLATQKVGKLWLLYNLSPAEAGDNQGGERGPRVLIF